MTEQQEEKHIIEKLEAQKNAVKPSQELLSKIIAQLPASPAGKPAQQEQSSFGVFQKEQHRLTWIRFAVPAGALLLVGGIFFIATQLETNPPAGGPSPVAISESLQQAEVITPVTAQKALSLASINTEEQKIEEDRILDDFFDDENQMQEIDMALAEF